MTIRARLTIWYAAMLAGSLLVLAVVLRHEWLEQEQRFEHRQAAESVWEEVGEILLNYGIPTALLLLAGGWWLMGKMLTPITELTRAVNRIHINNLQERLLSGRDDELGRLTDVFNAMMARLDDSFSRIREFTLNASHELKTPLTVMRGEIEILLADPDLSTADRDRLVSQMDEIQRLTQIVDGLSLLAKADSGQVALDFQPVPLDELVRDSFADAQILAQPLNIEVTLPHCEDITLTGDRHRLRQLLLNLTSNAINYNQPGGRVEMTLKRNGAGADIRIANTGPGIPKELIPRVCDRFFRGDVSHNDTVEGCGLGLSIAQWIVHAHHGTLDIQSEPGHETTVLVHLPFNQGKV